MSTPNEPNRVEAIAERLERLSSEKARQSDRAPTSTQRVAFDDQAAFFMEAAQALTASADEVEQLREAHQDAYEQWGLASRAHRKAEADLASARKALEPFAEACDDADDESVRDDVNTWEAAIGMCITYGDFRRAREALRVSTIGEEGEGKNSSSRDFATTDDGGDNSSLRSDATAEDELRAALRDLVSWAKVTPPSHRPHGLIARAEKALR